MHGTTVKKSNFPLNRLVFITEVESVYCAVPTKSSYVYNTDTFRPYRVTIYLLGLILLLNQKGKIGNTQLQFLNYTTTQFVFITIILFYFALFGF